MSLSPFTRRAQRGIALLGAMVFGVILLIAGATLLSVASNTLWMVERSEESEQLLLVAEGAMNHVLAYLQSVAAAEEGYPEGATPLADLVPPNTLEGRSVSAVLAADQTVTVTATAPAGSGISDVILTCTIDWDSPAEGLVKYENWQIVQW